MSSRQIFPKQSGLNRASTLLVAGALTFIQACSSPPPKSEAPGSSGTTTGGTGGNYTFDPVPTPSSSSTLDASGGGLYDASNLASKLGSILTPPAFNDCKSKGIALIRGLNKCSNVKLETGWCDFPSIISKFEALGSRTFNAEKAGIVGVTSASAFFNSAKDKGWLPDQCGTVDAGSGRRDPVVFLYMEPTGTSTGFKFLPVCFQVPAGAPVQFTDASRCEI